MKIKQSNADQFFFVIACIFTMGLALLVKATISEAIRSAIKEEE